MKGLSLLLIVAFLFGWTEVGPTSPKEQTQLELSQAAGKELKAAEAEMTALLGRLMKKGVGKKEAIAKLQRAQTAWKAYRDAQVGAKWPFPERGQYGSVYPMCAATELTNLTKARVVELQKMLTPIEGDACNSQWPD